MRVAGRGVATAVVAAAAAVALPAVQSPPELASLFPQRAEIFVDEAGLSRLMLPPEVLAQCQPDLADLRVVDRDGRELPYLVDGGPPPDAVFEELAVFEPRLLSASRETEERESAPDLRRETYELSLPEESLRRWDLVVDSRRPTFVRRFRVTATVAGEGEGEVVIAEGSLFRLLEPRRQKLRATLAATGADRVLVTLEGEGDSFVEPTFRLEASRVLPEREQMRVGLTILRRHSRQGRTVVELDRPRGLVPDQLLVATATGSFNRRFEVWDQGPDGAAGELGETTLYRLEGAAGVEKLEVTLRPARGEGLRVVIDDGDSPPLEDLAFQAALRRPSLVFSLPASAPGEPAGHLLFGGARAFRPRYGLAGLLPAGDRDLGGEAARIGLELRDVSRLALARLGPVEANPGWDPTPALAFAMRPGTEIATGSFGYRRAVPVPRTDEGLLRLRLDARTVARCRSDLADLRLVDSASRQWPYLLDRAGARERVALAVEGPETEDGTSSYSLVLPVGPLRLESLLLDSPAAYFDRSFELLGEPAGRGEPARTIARGRLSRRPDDPGELTIAIGGEPLAALELRVRDGDDPPLDWTTAEARITVPELFFAAPEGDYTLLFGDPEARPPRYELERVRDLVLAVDSTRVEAGDPARLPPPSWLARLRGEGGWQQALFWSALVLAALFLAWLTLRLARQGGASG